MQIKKNSSPPPDYFSRRIQLRLLMLVGLLVMTVMATNEARKPHNWYWLWAAEENASDLSEAAQNANMDHTVDTRLLAGSPRREGPADAFRALPYTRQAGESIVDEAVYFSGVDHEALLAIQNDRPLRAAERKSWFNLWHVLSENDEQTLRSNSTGPVGFVQLFKQPKVYHGRLVDFSGTVRAVHRVEMPPNDRGLDAYYVCWLRPMGGANSPMVVYSLALPPDFPTGENIREVVSVTGFFFKRMAYLAKDGSRTVPLIQSKTLHWQHFVTTSEMADGKRLGKGTRSTLVGLALLGSLVLGIVVAVGVYWLSVRPWPSRSLTPASQATSAQIAKLSEVNVMPDTKEMLRRLADHESST